MYLSGADHDPYLMIKPDSKLEDAKEEYLNGKYSVRLSGEFSENFLEEFKLKFKNINSLNLSSCYYYKTKKTFVYEIENLKSLSISLWKDSEFVLDCNTLPKSIDTLWITIWSKKHIVNIHSLNNNLEHLIISDFEEKDLTKLSSLTNLKSLSITRSKIKSLKGIETLTNLEYLSLGAVRSLTDISDITNLQKLKRIDIDICWKLQDFSPIGNLKNLEILELLDCKNLASIKFVEKMPNLRKLVALGTTVINDNDTTPAKNIPIFWGSQRSQYNVQYPEKEIKE